MNSRSAGILSQIQQRRAERKKPKIVVALKEISLDANQRSAVSTAQANTPRHTVTKKNVSRNSAALSVSMVLHLILASLISIYYIADRIESPGEPIRIDLVQENLTTKRPLIDNRKPPPFEPEKQETQVLPPDKPVTTAAGLLTTSDGFTILPEDAGTAVDVPMPSTNEGLIAREEDRNLSKPTPAVELDRKPPVLETERSQKSLIDKIEPIAPTDGELRTPDIPVESTVVYPQYKYKVKPDYPKNAKQAEKEGEVILQATIDVNGIPQKIVALTNLGFGLEEAAIKALEKTTFRPATKAGKPVPLQVQIPFEFTLED